MYVELKPPKPAKPRKEFVEWVEITTELKKQYLYLGLTQKDFREIAATLNQTDENIRLIFRGRRTRVKKVVWDAIVSYVNGRTIPDPPIQKVVPQKKVTPAKPPPQPEPILKDKPQNPITDTPKTKPSQAANNFLQKRRESKGLK